MVAVTAQQMTCLLYSICQKERVEFQQNVSGLDCEGQKIFFPSTEDGGMDSWSGPFHMTLSC